MQDNSVPLPEAGLSSLPSDAPVGAYQDVARLSLREFIEFGHLQEINRAYLHPRGLALAITLLDDTDKLDRVDVVEVLDYRADPEGVRFADGVLEEPDSRDKADRVCADLQQRKPVRERLLGYWQQPVPGHDCRKHAPPR